MALVPIIKAQETSVEPYLGMWALELDYQNNKAGWMEIRQENGYLDASVLWRSGSVYSVEFVFIERDHLFITNGSNIVREKDEAGNPIRIQHLINWFDVKKESENRISGTGHFPNRNGIGMESVSFTGKRIPEYASTPDLAKVKYGKPFQLFNGKDLTGWKLLENDAASGWKVVDGVMVNDPVQKEGKEHIHYGNLRTVGTFEDFNLKLQVNVPEGSNSGVYLRGIYEVQVMDSYGEPLDAHNMGALYSRIIPAISAEKPAGEWQDFDITLYKRHLTVVLNGKNIIDNQPVKGVTGGAITSDEFSAGPLYLQGDHGKVSYRNIVLTPVRE